MHGYEEDLDEEAGYDDYYSDDNGLDEYEDDEEEQQEVPPKEELEYLELRQKIKESIRKKQGKGSVPPQSSQDRRKKLPYNDFGSFFGPSRPVISSRVIQESKSLLENEIKNSNQPKKRPAPTSSSGVRNVSQEKRPKPVSAVRRKVETLKDTRDYSFLLSDDAELPVPKREPLSRSGSFRNSESQSAQLSARPKQQSSGINGRAAHGPPPREEKRPVVSANGHSRPSSSGSQMNHSRPGASSGSKMQSRPVSGRPASSGSSQLQHSRPTPSGSQMQQRAAPSGSQRPGSSINRQAPTRPQGSSMNGQSANRNGQPSSRSAPAKVPMDHRRQMSSSGHGVGPARSVSTSKPLPSRTALERKPSSSAGKSSLQSAQRPSSRPMSSDPRQQRLAEQQRKVSRDPSTSRMIPKQSAPTSKHQKMSKPAPKRPPQRDLDDRRPLKKKKPAVMSEDAKALSMIRQMFNTDRYAGRDYDDRDMEAGFDDIMKEERRSARIAREEDEKEARLIAEEEERERRRKLRKLRKLRLSLKNLCLRNQMVTKEDDCLPPAAEPSRCCSPSSTTPPAELETIRSLEIVESSFLSPVWLLVIFCIINLLNYMDRGAIASNGVNGSTKSCNDKGKCIPATGIQGHYNLSNFEDGVLSSSFMVGLLIASPVFASLAKSFNPFRLIGVGLTVWTVAVVGCGSSFAFWFIVLCRMFVGVGEASFISLAAPFIDDNAPHKQKAAWLGLFYMCIPSGVALGYVYGGYVGKHFSWRYAFWGEAVLMAPFAVLGFLIKPLQLKGFPSTDSVEVMASSLGAEVSKNNNHLQAGNEIKHDEVEVSIEIGRSSYANTVWKSITQFARDMKVLCKERVFVVNVLGSYVAYNFVIGAYSYWGPKAGYNIYKMKNADMIFGAVTIICGIVGTLSGGLILDHVTSTIPNAFKLLSGATFIGATCCFTAFTLKSLYGFVALFAIGELLVFATQAPVNYVCLHCVEPSLRPLSMAISTVAIHIFGDVPSSPLVGIVQDHIDSWRKTALILTSVLFLAAAIWFIGMFINIVDRFNEEAESENPRSRQEQSIMVMNS
ncbi:hypothetical protein HID58_062065 [Brassica napus]|uniref:Major facilitator superfamily (MFS) profile domain-containing protein n=1 Tax=Brassica napus TaxID=3708 RepID=A0ABQ8A0F8_BRANA|nr:hypothetical protein HID58_062065 [Brassica napus]